jgi:hypothetical protein
MAYVNLNYAVRGNDNKVAAELIVNGEVQTFVYDFWRGELLKTFLSLYDLAIDETQTGPEWVTKDCARWNCVSI